MSKKLNFVAASKKLNRITATFVALTLAFLVVFLILTIVPNYDAATLFNSFFVNPFKNSQRIQEIVLTFSAFLIGSLAVLICYRIGFINLNVAGQMAATVLVIYIVGRNLNGLEGETKNYNWLPLIVFIGLTISVSMSLFIACIRIYYGVNEVLSGIFLNAIVSHIFRAVVKYSNWTNDTSLSTNLGLEKSIGLNYIFLEVLSISFFVAIAIFFFVAFVLRRTQFGFKLKVIGEFRAATKYAGINSVRVILCTFAMAGLLAGIAGIFYYYRDPQNTNLYAEESLPANGFDTLTIVWLAQTSIFILPITTLFIVWLRTQQSVIPVSAVDAEIVNLLVGLSLLFISFVNQYYVDPILQKKIQRLTDWLRSIKKNKPQSKIKGPPKIMNHKISPRLV